MKLSIIIPCYNAQRYLAECLQSLLTQSFADFEAILVDDGSVDNTAEIACAFAAQDARVRVIRQENAGVSAARNRGLREAGGEWVLFVDADDLLCIDALSTLLSFAKEGVDMVVSLHETFCETSAAQTVYPQTLWMNLNGEARRHAAALRLIEGDTVLNVMCNKLHRRQALVRSGVTLEEGVRIAEDALFNLEALLCAQDIAFCEHVTYRYRIHAASATQTREKSEFDVHLPWMKAMAKMLKRRGVMETYYAPYVASVTLRLYKDGGVSGVMKQFNRQAKPLTQMPLDGKKLSVRAKALRFLCEKGLYPAAYPLIFPFELAARKISELSFALRVRRMNRG